MNVQNRILKKRTANPSIDADLLTASKIASVKPTQVLDKKSKEVSDANFKRQLAGLIEYENDQIEKHGIWSDGLRSW